MTEGDHIKITVFNSNSSTHAHSLHMHSIHSGEMDGMMGPAGTIPPGGSFYLQLYSIAVWCLPLPLPCGAGNIAHQPRLVWHDDYRPENTETRLKRW